MNRLETLKRIVEGKAKEVTEPVVYTGRIQDGRWVATSLADRYNEIVHIVEVTDETNPIERINDFEFVGGNNHRMVYVKKEVVDKWLETANNDSHWGGAAMLRPGKLTDKNLVFTWEGYTVEETDEGLLAIMSEQDWRAFIKAFELPEDSRLAQVTIFDLEMGVSAKGTIRQILPGELPTIFKNAWKRFGSLRTRFTSVLTVDSVYTPRASINTQELQYWANGEIAEWMWQALDAEIQRILEFKYSPWITTGYLQKLGFSPAWNITMASVREHLTGELKKLLRRIKLPKQYGLRAKSSASSLVKDSEVLLPAEARKFVKVGDTVWVSRNPALPSQGWGVYKVAGFVDGNFVVFAQEDRQWSHLLGGDHDGDDCVVFYQAPVEGYTQPEDWLDLQKIKPSGRKLEGNTVEERIARWKNETTVNIGQFDLAARRLLAVGRLTDDARKLYTIAIQTAISLKKRVARLEDQPWYPLLMEYQKLANQLTGTTWVDAIREGYKPVGGPEWAVRLWERVQAAITQVNKMTPRLWLTESKVRGFSVNAQPKDKWVFEYLQHLKQLKAQALANDEQLAWEINREIREFIHVRGPEYLLELPEEEWKEFSRWAIGNMHSSEWVFMCHPEVLEELYTAFGKETMVAMLEGNHHTLKIGDVFEVDETEAIERKFEIDGQTYILLDDTGFIKAGTRYQVTRVRKQVVEFVEIQ